APVFRQLFLEAIDVPAVQPRVGAAHRLGLAGFGGRLGSWRGRLAQVEDDLGDRDKRDRYLAQRDPRVRAGLTLRLGDQRGQRGHQLPLRPDVALLSLLVDLPRFTAAVQPALVQRRQIVVRRHAGWAPPPGGGLALHQPPRALAAFAFEAASAGALRAG